MKKSIFIILLLLIPAQFSAQPAGKGEKNISDSDSISVRDSAKTILPRADAFPDSLNDSVGTKSRSIKPVVKRVALLGVKSYNQMIKRESIISSDYRYTGDIMELLPFSFLQDLGVTGQPSELLLFGLGNGSVSYSINGTQKNNRWKNSLNLYHVQPELIDSVEYLPLTSGFLYNPFNNPVHVNYMSRDGVVTRPYSRIRFYQAAYEEGFIDVIYNTRLFESTYLFIEASNMSIDRLVETNNDDVDFNNDFSLWNVETKLSYLLNDYANIALSYNHVKENTELYGGVENRAGMYNVNDAVLMYYDRNQRVTRNDFELSLNAELIENSPLFISGYYQYNLQEYNSNLGEIADNLPSFEHDNKYKTYGLYGRQVLRYSVFNLDLIGNYEHTVYNTELFGNVADDNILTAASRLSLNLFDTITPSFFVKTSNYRKVQYNGFGVEGIINLNNNVRLFGGISFAEKPFSVIEDKFMSEDVGISKQKQNIVQIQAQYKSDKLCTSVGYFYYKNDNMPLPVIYKENDSLVVNEISEFQTEILERSGINLQFSYKVWKLLFENNSSYYLDNNSNRFNSLPEYTVRAGLYYVDTLFNGSLNLKAGANFTLTGRKSFVTYDFEKSLPVYYYGNDREKQLSALNNSMVPLNKQVDLFVAGTIQKNAIVYITYENLLGEDYFIVPYYPIYRQGLRIGVSWEFYD